MEQAPRRTCVGCRTSRAKPELRRLAATPDGVVVDPEQRLPGRGAYVCPDTSCLDRIERAKGQPLRRALRDPHPDQITAALSALRDALTNTPQTPGGHRAPGQTGRPVATTKE